MTDKKQQHDEIAGLSRRGFLGASAVTGAAALVTEGSMGAFTSNKAWADAVKCAQDEASVAPVNSMNTTVSGAAATPARCAYWAFPRCAS